MQSFQTQLDIVYFKIVIKGWDYQVQHMTVARTSVSVDTLRNHWENVDGYTGIECILI